MNFYIKKLEVNSKEEIVSIVEFRSGLNIITGTSNTGKSLIYKCIDFCLGAKKNPLHEYMDMEYTHISLYIVADDKELSISRHIDSTDIQVTSNIPNIDSGVYNVNNKNYNKSLNSIMLKLLGINERHEIIKNKNFAKQELTWRSFYHMFFIDEDRIHEAISPLFNGILSANTASLSILIFLLYHEDFQDIEAYDRKEIKTAKKNAIENYINQEIEDFSKRTAQLQAELIEFSENDIKKRIAVIIDEIENTQNIMNISIEESKNIVKEIYSKNEILTQDTMLLSRYKLLENQYNSDLARLNFIVDGQINYEKNKETDCPFCNNKIFIKEKPDYIDASLHNYKKIMMQINDLKEAIHSLAEEIKQIDNEINTLKNQKKCLDRKIDIQLKPKIEELKNELQIYENYIEKNNEIQLLKNICINKNKYIADQKKIKDNDTEYKPKEYLEDSFIIEFSNIIKRVLEEGHYENLNTVSIDEKTMDIVVNGKKKSNNGKGYKAYFNSITSIALIKHLLEKGFYKPPILILDSPLLSLKLASEEKETQSIKQSIKDGLLEILINLPTQLQTIVIENEIPEIDYKSTNIIRFTKNKEIGRYGFLKGVYD